MREPWRSLHQLLCPTPFLLSQSCSQSCWKHESTGLEVAAPQPPWQKRPLAWSMQLMKVICAKLAGSAGFHITSFPEKPQELLGNARVWSSRSQSGPLANRGKSFSKGIISGIAVGHHSLLPHRFVILLAFEELNKGEVQGTSISAFSCLYV